MPPSVEVTLDLTFGAHLRAVGIATAGTQRTALAEQVPALVELDLDRLQPGVFLGFVDLAVLQFVAQLPLLGDEFVD